ncbi:MAG TPA: ABC transporter permease [Gaiellaceae bacterium]|nr:ABC transporter permease [Gaiellaceae bacterium]
MAVTERDLEQAESGNGWAPMEEPEAPRRQQFLYALSRSWLFLFLVVLMAYFWRFTPSGTFLTWDNLAQIALNTSEVVLLAIGETFVITTAGIDLSIGGILFFAGVAGGEVMLALSGTSEQTLAGHYPHAGLGIPVGVVVCIAAGGAWGFINGLIITRMKLPPIIVTLGTMAMTFGFGDLIDGGSYLPSPVPPSLSDGFGAGKFLGLYYPIWLAIGILAIAHLVYQHTRFGRYTAAVGSNEEGTRRTGIAVDRHIIKVYGLCGLLAGTAAVVDLAIFTNTTSVAHQNDNLSAISAVVIGGTSVFGGVGTILLSAVGAFIPTVLTNGLVIQDVQPFWQEVVVGATIVVAVYFDQLRRRRINR